MRAGSALRLGCGASAPVPVRNKRPGKRPPSGLVRGPKIFIGLAVETFIEENRVAPDRVFRKRRFVPFGGRPSFSSSKNRLKRRRSSSAATSCRLAVQPDPVGSRGDQLEIPEKLDCDILVDQVTAREQHCDLEHVEAELRHPGRAVQLFKNFARKRLRRVKRADVVEPEETAFEDIISRAPSRFIHQVKLIKSL
jgi:hypothetical protein